MNILAIETATEFCSVALRCGTELLNRHQRAARRHASLLLPWIEQLLAEAQITLQQLDAIAYGRGPGSFTSLRLGIGVVQGLAYGADIGVCGVSSLAALAQSSAELAPGHTLLVATDARMQEVFTGSYLVSADGLVATDVQEVVCPPLEIALPATACFGLGNGFSTYQPVLQERLGDKLLGFDADCWPDARSVIQLSAALIERGEIDSAEQALPVYIRDQVARKPG